jgi:hypothetical protein
LGGPARITGLIGPRPAPKSRAVVLFLLALIASRSSVRVCSDMKLFVSWHRGVMVYHFQGVVGIVTLKKKIRIWRLPRPDNMDP